MWPVQLGNFPFCNFGTRGRLKVESLANGWEVRKETNSDLSVLEAQEVFSRLVLHTCRQLRRRVGTDLDQ